jgi:hypothetical protein
MSSNKDTKIGNEGSNKGESKMKDKGKSDVTRDESEDLEDTDSEIGSLYFIHAAVGTLIIPRRTVMTIVL